MKVDTVVKNGLVVTTEGTFEAAIAVAGEKIVAITGNGNAPEADKVIDARGNYVIPGLIDSHMHFVFPPGDREERLTGESQAAAAGGCTTAVTLQIDHVLGSIVDMFNELKNVYDEYSYVDWGCNAFIVSTDHIKEMRPALECGISSFKFLLPYKGRETIAGLPDTDDGLVYLGLQEIGKLVKEGYKTFARIHAESIEAFFRIEDRYVELGLEPASYTEVRPNFIEADAMQRVILFAKETGAPLVIVHMSIKEGPAIISRAKMEGVDILAETLPSYLILNTENADKFVSKVNPPIRNKADNEALWRALQDGIIECVGTDHAPRTREERGSDFWRAPVGMPGVETWLPIMLSEGVNKGRISMERLVQVCSYNNAKKNGLLPRKGMIAIGSDADLVIVDLKKKKKVRGEELYTRAKDYTPLEGWEFQGWPILTMLRGKVIAENSRCVGEAGYGEFIPAKLK